MGSLLACARANCRLKNCRWVPAGQKCSLHGAQRRGRQGVFSLPACRMVAFVPQGEECTSKLSCVGQAPDFQQ